MTTDPLRGRTFLTKNEFTAELVADGFNFEHPSSVLCDQHGAICTWEWEAGHRPYYYMAAEKGLGTDNWVFTKNSAL